MGLTPDSRRDSPFLRACRGDIPERTPVWILRQAGRYLPQYRAVRARFPNFLDFLAHPEAAAEVTLQPPALLDVDAAILFSDILTVLPPLGLELAFLEGEGPRIANPLTESRLAGLPRFDPVQEIPHVYETVRLCRAQLPAHLPLIGFAASPWTLACYAVDGGGSRDFSKVRSWMHRSPVSFRVLLEKLADVLVDHLSAQAEAGCDALQIFESWGSLVASEDYRAHILPVIQRMTSELRDRTGKPVIFYVNGASTLLDEVADAGADVVAIDWRISLAKARARVGTTPLQGNFDPTLLHAPLETIAERVRTAAAQAKGGAWIANLGHGIQPDAPVAGLKALIDAVHALQP